MEVTDILQVVFRAAHIIAAITAVGGTIFARLVVLPSTAAIDETQRQALMDAMRARWAKIVGMATGMLIVSGLFNIARTFSTYDVPPVYHMLFGVKLLLALGVFAVAGLLAGRTAAAERVRKNAKFWLNLNIAMALTLVILSAGLSTFEKVPKPVEPASEAPPWLSDEP